MLLIFVPFVLQENRSGTIMYFIIIAQDLDLSQELFIVV
jgi:hypothetical protein